MPEMMRLSTEVFPVMGHGPNVGTKEYRCVVAARKTGQIIDTEVLSKYCAECHVKRGADTSAEEFLELYEET